MAEIDTKSKSDLKDIFHSALKAVSPNEIVRNKVRYHDNILYVNENSFQLRGDVYLVGFGKAVMGMAIELEKILNGILKKGIVSIPSSTKETVWLFQGESTTFPKLHNSAIEYHEGGINNQPDSKSLETTHKIIDLVEKLTETDTLIVLVSGGGSALLYMPRPIFDQEDKLELCKKLQNAGANITELNTVRKKLSLVKGGGLARIAYPASVITLILSDIVGDPIDLIASGPTVYSSRAPETVIAILKKYNLYQTLEGDLKTVVTSKETFDDSPLLSPVKQFKHVTNIILGNNTMSLEAASIAALRKKMTPIILRNDVTGDVRDVSLAYVEITSLICLALLKELKREEFYDRVRNMPILALSSDKVDEIFYRINDNINGIILIGGGEPTVVVKGQGKGGRNQELALHFSLNWLAKIKSYPRFAEYDVIMLSAGTDGQDGPTDAAGAFGYPAIASIMHDLYTKIKLMANQGVTQILSEQKIQTIDKNSLTRNLCKGQELNEFITESNTRLQEQDVSNKKAINGDINEHIPPLNLTLMEVERMLPENTLKENDTYNFYSRFKKGTDLIKTGFTGTNVMDLHFIYIKKRTCGCDINFSDKSKYEDIDTHDLHIDTSTIEKYKAIHTPSKFDKDKFLYDASMISKEELFLNLKIIDDNFKDPCCNKIRKFDQQKDT